MNDLQRIGFLGKLNLDDDPLYVKSGDYTDALNVRPTTDSTESSQSIVNILGNEYACSLGTVSQQNKIYVIYIDSTSIRKHFYDLKDQNNIALVASFTILQPTGTFTAAYNSMKSDFISILSAGGFTYNISSKTIDTNHGYLILEITSNLGLDYNLLDGASFSSTIPSIQVIQESIDKTLTGNLQIIGSYDLLGDLFVFSTTQTNLPSTITATILSITAGTPSTVTTNIVHGFTTADIGKLIVISGAVNSLYNGSFIIGSVPSTTTFTLAGTNVSMGASASGGSIKINPNGIGEIGVITNDINLGTFTYTRLLRSKELNFVTKKQIDSYVEKNAELISFYWTDFYNVPRVLYYKGDYITDGTIAYYNSLGQYSYGTIDLETKLFLNQTPVVFTFTGQQQSGGSLLAGNWRYSYRFVSESGASTEWSDLSNPIPVFKSSTNSAASTLSGDETGVLTTKANSFTISNIPASIYKYIELAGIYYTSSNSEIGYIIKRELLGATTTINISHTGLESYTSLDLATLNVRDIGYNTAKNILALDNRLILSNLTLNESVDFSAWTQTWKHSLLKTPIQGVGLVLDSLSLGEYNNPSNVYNYTGYMDNETYRFVAKFKLKNGGFTNTFFIDDIRFDTSSTNINYDGVTNRRLNGLPHYNLTDDSSDMTVTYVTNLSFSNIDLDFNINGVAVRELIDSIIIERVDCVKEVLCTGMAAMTVYNTAYSSVGSLTTPNHTLWYDNYSGSSVIPYRGENAFCESLQADSGTILLYPQGQADRQVLAFYSPDILYGNIGISNIGSANGDVIFNYGSPNIKSANLFNSGSKQYSSSIADYNGYTNQTSLTSVSVDILKNFGAGESNSFAGSNYSKSLKTYQTEPPTTTSTPYGFVWNNIATPVIKTSSNLTNVSGNPDYGFYYIQYKRPITYNSINDNKYGNINSNKSIPVGSNTIIKNTTTSPLAITIFGGDTFTQKNYVKRRFAFSNSGGATSDVGFGAGTCFYSQNRVNTQLNKKYDDAYGTWIYPNKDTASWLELTATEINAPVNYNTGYNPVNNINSDVSFDSSTVQVTNYPSRIIYSDIKLQNGLVDGYRNFLPLNFKDLDLSFGEIVHMANGNGELITWQPRKFQRQYFNTTGILQTSSNLNVLIGDGSVLSRNGQTLSSIGSKHKWGIIKGKSVQGNDTFYWINTELKKSIRFGYDGTISLADMSGMQSFLANNLTWVNLQDNPADGNGISGVWDDRFMELLWTVRGKRNVSQWNSATTYSIGEVVSYTPASFSTYEQTGEIYKATAANTNKNPSTFTNYWELIPHTNSNYYNEFTLCYNEKRNGFTSFYSFLPKLFLKWKDTFFSPQPTSKSNDIYIHNKGDYCVWYNDGATSKTEDGYIEGIVNNQPDTVKWFEANRTNSEIRPERIDYKTKTQISFVTSSEINSREGNFDNPIKMDSTGLTVNDSQTSRLFGKYLKVKIIFKSSVYQKLFDIIVKFRNSVRLPQK